MGGGYSPRKPKGIWTEIHDLEPGLYEICRYGVRKTVMVWIKDGAAAYCEVSAERAAAMAALLHIEETTFEEARLATRKAAV